MIMCKEKKVCFFDKAQYLLGEKIEILLPAKPNEVKVTVFELEKAVCCNWRIDGLRINIEGMPCGSYGITIETHDWLWEGAFDVVRDHREITRYGFLSDFSSEDDGISDVDWMRNLHLNAVQFYDWMYRHDELLSLSENYTDPMGRATNLNIIGKKIKACRRYGIRPFAYGAVYAATSRTAEKHPEWCMYTISGKPLTFSGWLYYMNISLDCGWVEHLMKEYRKTISFGFSGIHMDTYGFPKRAWSFDGIPIDLKDAFVPLVNRAAKEVAEIVPEAGVIFNSVNNWPVETVARTMQDSVYIEVWPPNDRYFDLYTLIREARFLSKKNVILAAYLKAFEYEDAAAAERSFRLSWASICASGGTQFVLGEGGCLLRDSYYVNHARLRYDFLDTVQRNCDFMVRYSNLLYGDDGIDISRTASGGINEDICFESPNVSFSTVGEGDCIWTIIRESRDRISINLVNLLGNDSIWNKPKNEPVETLNIRIKLRLDRIVKGVYCSSPDFDFQKPIELEHEMMETEQGRVYTMIVPRTEYWTLVWIKLEV